MYLDCGQYGRAKLKRITPTSVVLWESFDAPPCQADLIVRVDGQERVVRVDVVSGLNRDRLAAMVLPIDNVAPF